MKLDVFELINQHLEGGVFHLPSVFDYEDNFDEFAGIIGIARKKGVTVVFDNENEVFEPVSSAEDSLRLVEWSAYFMMNKLHVKHYMNYMATKNQTESNSNRLRS